MHGMRAFKKREEKKKDIIHPITIIHAALLFTKPPGLFFHRRIYT